MTTTDTGCAIEGCGAAGMTCTYCGDVMCDEHAGNGYSCCDGGVEPDTDYICAVCHDCTDLTSAERAMAIAGTLLDDEGLYYCAGCWADVYGARS